MKLKELIDNLDGSHLICLESTKDGYLFETYSESNALKHYTDCEIRSIRALRGKNLSALRIVLK